MMVFSTSFSPTCLVLVSLAGAVMLTVWLGVAIKDRYVGRDHRFRDWTLFQARHAPSASNFALRFFYEFFLELCLCVLINLAVRDFSSFSSGVQWLLSLCVATGVVAYCGWLISLFFYNGPFLKNFYKKGTLLRSTWSARPFSTDYRAQLKLEQARLRRL